MSWNRRRRILALRSVAGLFLTLTVVAVGSVAFIPLPSTDSAQAFSPNDRTVSASAPSFNNQLFDARLQGPLEDPPKKEIKIVQPPTTTVRLPANLKLEAILYSSQKPLAIFTENSTTSICGVGEQIGAVLVKSIQNDSVTLRYRGQDFEIGVK